MPDPEDTTEETVTADTAAQDATDTQEQLSEDEVLGWDGKPFEIDRFKTAFDRLRQERNEARDRFDQLQTDEDAYRRLGADKWGFEFDIDDDTADDDDTDTRDDTGGDATAQRIQALEQREQARENAAREAAFDRDLNEIATTVDLELDEFDREWVADRASKDPKGFNRESVERAVKARKDWYEQREQAVLERYRGTKKTSTVAPGGKTATEQPDMDDRNERRAWIAEQMRQRSGST